MASMVTLNGRELARDTEWEGLKNGELNWLLGEGGRPKYSEGQMKNITKQALADEVRTVVASIPEARVKGPRTQGVGRGNARPPSISKTKAVAQSKKCNLLKAFTQGKTTEDHIRAVLAVDTVLADYWKTVDQDLVNAQQGVRPKQTMVRVVKVEDAGAQAEEVEEAEQLEEQHV